MILKYSKKLCLILAIATPTLLQAADLPSTINNFSLKLFKQTVTKQQNTILSPLSVYSVFAMLYPGARGSTKQRMQQLFQYPNDLQKVADYDKQLESYNTQTTGLWMANAVWVNNKIYIYPSYQTTLQNIFNINIKPINFDDAQAVNVINAWVANHTQQMILHIFKPGDLNNQTMLLVNAVLFNNKWQSPFDLANTDQQKFYTSRTQSKQVTMMHQTTAYNYMENTQLQMIELPYKQNHFSMLVLLPKAHHDLNTLVQQLSTHKLNQWQKQLKPYTVQLSLPKLDFTNMIPLNLALQNLGLSSVFSYANFSALSKQALTVSGVLQKARIQIDESGTKAAAVTGTFMAGAEYNPTPPKIIVMNVNVPYLIIIKDNQTDSIIFIGQIYQPLQDIDHK